MRAFFIFIIILFTSLSSLAEEEITATTASPDIEESIDTGEGEDEAGGQDASLKPPGSSVRGVSADFEEYKVAKIVALNKITAKSLSLNIPVGKSIYFGNIEIKVYKCLKNTDPYRPENKILVSVVESKVDEDQIVLFNGWMFASSVSLSSFEHPVYEVFAKDCE